MSNRVLLILGIAALSFFAGLTGVRLAYTLTYVLLGLLILSFLWSRAIVRRLRVRRESPHGSFVVGEPFHERFTVHNGSLLPIPYCEVHDLSRLEGYAPGRACSLNSGDSVTWTARGVFTKRGPHTFGPLVAQVGDPFGLFPRRREVAGASQVLVYPAIHPVAELGARWSGGSFGDLPFGRAIDIPPDVSTVRDYDSADGMSRIHWRASARTGRLMSRSFDTRQSGDLLVVLDLRHGIHAGVAPESSLEYAVSLAASIAHGWLRRAAAVGLVSNDAAVTAIGPGRGDSQRQRILDFLALAADDGALPVGELIARHGEGWRGRGGLVVITADRDPSWVARLVDVGARGQRHQVIFVDPVSFGADGPPLRVAAAWRLAVDWWTVRRGDVLAVGRTTSRAIG